MLERTRRLRLAWAAFCVVLFVFLGVAVGRDWGWLTDVDSLGRHATDWAQAHTLRGPLRVVEVGFNTLGTTVLTLLLAGAMLSRGHRRAAVFTVVAMAAATVAFRVAKVIVARPRPPWQWAEHPLASQSYPSGHATTTSALGGVAIVLVLMLVRRRAVRRLLTALTVLVVALVCADRVLLGRHYPTDVVGGAALGAAVVLVTLLLFSPLPRSHAEKIVPLTEPVPSERRLAVVLNPIKVEDEALFRETVATMARESGWQEPTWHLTTPEDSGTGQAERAAVEGADLVIVCGGDGTVREVCAELAGTGIPVGIVPAGTGNLLARNLDIPLYIRAAVDIALTGQDRAIDLVRVTGDVAGESADDSGDGDEPGEAGGAGTAPGFESHFLVMAGMGFDAAIMEGVNEDIKKRVGWLAYVLSALKSLMFPATGVEISVDGGEYTRHRARTIVVGNVGYLQAGMPLLPDAAIDDGRLDVVLLYPRRFLSWIPLAVRVLTKRRRTDATIDRMTGRTVSIRAAMATPRQLDGDSIGAGRELHMECVHGRLLVRVPR